MSVSAETYIVISLMFAVFAAVAAVGTSVVLGAGFERLRAGFDVVKRQSGFFADAIYKLDQRTQKLDEEQAKLKAGVYSVNERIDRVEKQVTFMGDAVTSIEQRILQGTPVHQPAKHTGNVQMHAVHTVQRKPAQPVQAPSRQQQGWISTPVKDTGREQPRPQPQASLSMRDEPVIGGMFKDFPEEMPVSNDLYSPKGSAAEEREDSSASLTTLLSRYFTGEQSGSGKGVVYH